MSHPVERIRAHLQDVDGPGFTTTAKLVGWWQLDPASSAAREQVAADLRRRGMETVPPLGEVTDVDAQISVRFREAPAPAPVAAPVPAPEPPARPAPSAREPRPPRPPREPLRLPELPALRAPSLDAGLLGGGAAVVVLGLFLPWFKATSDGEVLGDLSSGWDWLPVLDVVLLGVAAGAVAFAAVGRAMAEATVLARALLGIGALTFLALLLRMASPPEGLRDGLLVEAQIRVGPLVTTLGLVAVLAGASVHAGLPATVRRPRAAADG